MNTSPNVMAGGNIPICSFVKLSAANTVVVGGADDNCIGVSQEGGRQAPTPDAPSTIYAAISGDPVKIYGDGDECLILVGAGGSVAAGDVVVSDSAGAALTAVTRAAASLVSTGTKTCFMGRMLEGGAVGELRRMIILVSPGYR